MLRLSPEEAIDVAKVLGDQYGGHTYEPYSALTDALEADGYSLEEL